MRKTSLCLINNIIFCRTKFRFAQKKKGRKSNGSVNVLDRLGVLSHGARINDLLPDTRGEDVTGYHVGAHWWSRCRAVIHIQPIQLIQPPTEINPFFCHIAQQMSRLVVFLTLPASTQIPEMTKWRNDGMSEWPGCPVFYVTLHGSFFLLYPLSSPLLFLN